ncbi:hypothetical protein NCER_102623 [Vairimorpha ceranae BRL01]|uniref:Uncharacterized protein n=1 Tax=Vairimorpha ceranae (strain BRL01) TaxID=578460 RepID=C4VCA3_VAIC1|nr:hypothetical protein NCER_102623 [Vairimorpha ceranae BRL01]
MPQFIKKLERSNISNDLKEKSVLALRNILSFLDTVSAIRFDTRKTKNKKIFLNLLNLAYNQFSGYAGVFQKVLIFRSICKSLHKVNDSVYYCMSCCDFYKVNRFLLRIDNRLTSIYSKLLELNQIFEKKDD